MKNRLNAESAKNVIEYETPDFWNTLGVSFAYLIYSSGIKAALSYLVGMLKPVKHVCRINLGCSSLTEEKFIVPLADTDAAGMECTRIPNSKKPFSIISEHTISQPTIINRLDELKEEALKVDPSVSALPFFNHSSMLRLPVFQKNSLQFWIIFWSDQVSAFSESDVNLFTALLAPALKSLQNALSCDFAPEASTQNEPLNFVPLHRLSGLSSVYKQIQQVAPNDTTVLITGESGVGKEFVAETIYKLSKRKNGPFICVNCGAFTPSLLCSELFGAEKGAYTGANYTREGYFEYASGGTIFLDEIGDMTPEAQVSLLRVLDKKIIQRVGSPRSIPVNVRVIAATNKNLQEMVEQGKFRKDLYYRLSPYPIHVQPLRLRREDILPVARGIMRRKITEFQLSPELKLNPAEEAKLLAYDWPGNVRELVNVMEKSLIDHPRASKILQINLPQKPVFNETTETGEWITLEELEKNHIARTLARANGKLSGKDGAAALLGIHYTTLHAKLKKYGLQT